MTNINLIEYYITLTRGADTYKMKVDTESYYMTLPSSAQTNSHTGNLFTCDGTCTKSNTETIVEYGGTLSMTGNIAQEDFTLSDKAITDLRFLLATSEVGFEGLVCDGMLGLSLASFFEGEKSGLMYYLLEQSIVPLKQIGVYLSSTSNDSTSQITLGGYDTARAVNVKWIPLKTEDSWTIAIDGYKIGSAQTTGASTLLMTTGL